MKNAKVVLYCQNSQGNSDPVYGTGGEIHREIERELRKKIEFLSFNGYLSDEKARGFEAVCADADVVILDAQSCQDDPLKTPSNYDELERVAWSLVRAPSKPIILAILKEGKETAVHSVALPIRNWHDSQIIAAVEIARARHLSRRGQKRILVVDDNTENLAAAKELRWAGTVLTCSSYLKAMRLLDGIPFDIVMTDLMMPADEENQGQRSLEEYVGQQMPMGAFVAAKALEKGVKHIFVVSDTGHHAHPVGHVAEELSKKGPIRWFCGGYCKKIANIKGEYVKDWGTILRS